MQFTGLSIDHFGMFSEFTLANLSPGLTVIHGGNGTGKTTLVQFLRGILFGFNGTAVSDGFRDIQNAGYVDADLQQRQLRIRRRTRTAGTDDFQITDRIAGTGLPTGGNRLPDWVTEAVFREIFTVGHLEAEQFELLTRLCLAGPLGSGSIEAEIRRTETALNLAVRERTGHGVNPGLTCSLHELAMRRRSLTEELSALRRVNPSVPAGIAEIERELALLKQAVMSLAGGIDELKAEIARLEQRRAELLQRNSLKLDREQLQLEIDQLSQRMAGWDEIRSGIERQGLSTSTISDSKPHAHESLSSVRAIIGRLEHRLADLEQQRMGSATAGTGTTAENGMSASKLHEHLQSEVFALCDYAARHESAVVAHEQGLEAMFALRALQNIASLQDVIRGRRECLVQELQRADNILAAEHLASRATSCVLEAHRDFRRAGLQQDDSELHDVDARLRKLRSEVEELTVQRQHQADRISPLERELEDLRRQLASAARLEDVDRLNAQIAELDAQTELQQARLNVLQRTEAGLREVIARLQDRRQPQVLEVASGYLRRLTEDECTRFGITEERTGLTVHTRRVPSPLPLSQLSRGTRDQAALALRLALIQVRAADAERVPLVLDDVFIAADDDRAEAAADLLMELASAGQQILLLTSQNDVRDLFIRRRAVVRSLEGLPVPSPLPMTPVAPVIAPPPRPVPATPVAVQPPVAVEPVVAEQSLVFKAFEGEAEEFPGEMAERMADVSAEPDAKWLFYLETDSPVEDLAGLTVAEIAALQSVDIQTIDELLQIQAADLEHTFREHGFLIDSDRIQAWQGQAEMACRIPMLRRRDAALLYAAGICSVEHVSRLRPETLFDLLTVFQASDTGSHYLRGGRGIDRQEAINWTRWALHARSLQDARRHRHEFQNRSATRFAAGRSSRTADSSITRVTGRSGASSTSSGEGSVRRQRRPRISGESRRTRSERFSRRRRRMERKTDSQRTTRVSSRLSDRANQRASVSRLTGSRSTGNGISNGNGGHSSSPVNASDRHEWKFYLSRSSDIEAAPSIGPKTAERLAKVNIVTVDDLLNASPETLAAQLNNRRITADVIEQWQAQAALVCQIPQLRGHDAQILVACGYAEAEEVASQQPADLFAEIAPFCDTTEGERIVRNGRKPDLAEVTDWITWAQNCRSLKAA